MKSTDQKSEWTQARSVLAAMRSHARRRLAGQILLGKFLLEIKRKAGLEGRGGDRRSKAQSELLKSGGRTWNELCQKELGISKPTADRWIYRFEKAAEFARTMPEAGNILLVPSAELSGDEIETLANFVEKLVDDMTKSALEIELGIKIEPTDDDQEDETGSSPGDFQEALEHEALVFFASIPRKIAAMRQAIAGFRDYSKYKFLLSKLPLDDGREGKPSLLGIKEGLEAAWGKEMSSILTDISEAIESKSCGAPPKRGRAKSLTKKAK